MQRLIHGIAAALPGIFLLAMTACAPSSTPLAPSPIPLSQSPSITPPTPTAVPTSAFAEGTPETPMDLRGLFVYSAGDGSLWTQDARGGEPTPLVERSTEAIAQQPSFAPDGKTVAYSALLFEPNGNLYGDIRGIAAKGGSAQNLVKAETKDTVYFYPRFARDGRLLVTHAEQLQTTNERTWLEWVNVNGNGAHTHIIDDARDADVSPDGTRVAFVRTEPATQVSSLWIANSDGTQPEQLVDSQTFIAILNPRFSPDGEWLAFGAHGAANKTLPRAVRSSQTGLADCAVEILIFCFAGRAYAHVAPGALWRVNLQTAKFQALTDIYDDSPVPAWSGDGTQVAIHDYTGIRLIDLTRKKLYPLFLEDGGNGGFDWTPF